MIHFEESTYYTTTLCLKSPNLLDQTIARNLISIETMAKVEVLITLTFYIYK